MKITYHKKTVHTLRMHVCMHTQIITTITTHNYVRTFSMRSRHSELSIQSISDQLIPSLHINRRNRELHKSAFIGIMNYYYTHAQ